MKVCLKNFSNNDYFSFENCISEYGTYYKIDKLKNKRITK